MVLHGTTGWLTSGDEPGAAAAIVVELLVDPALRRRMGEAARERAVRHYTLDDAIEATAQLLTRVAQPRKIAFSKKLCTSHPWKVSRP